MISATLIQDFILTTFSQNRNRGSWPRELKKHTITLWIETSITNTNALFTKPLKRQLLQNTITYQSAPRDRTTLNSRLQRKNSSFSTKPPCDLTATLKRPWKEKSTKQHAITRPTKICMKNNDPHNRSTSLGQLYQIDQKTTHWKFIQTKILKIPAIPQKNIIKLQQAESECQAEIEGKLCSAVVGSEEGYTS